MKLLDRIPTLTQTATNEPAAGLRNLARNLMWTWRTADQELFAEVNPSNWARQRDAFALLEDPEAAKLSKEGGFAKKIDSALAGQEAYLQDKDTWFARLADKGSVSADHPIAYFCAEYGFHETYNQYAGGLGILAGDHCKEASDLGLPFVAVGLFYSRGYFFQSVDWSGRQEHIYGTMAPEACGLERVAEPHSGKPLSVSVEFPGRLVHAAVWVARVGRVPVLLLDTNVSENSPEDRVITSQLYTNWREMRFHQEVILGLGGVRALEALGIRPSIWHMNEGHSALLVLERLLRLTEGGSSLAEARRIVSGSSVLTIHTPVPEGNERFSVALAKQLLGPMLKGTKVPLDKVLRLARDPKGDKTIFDMTALGLRHAFAANGVSLLHGETAHATWGKLLPFPVTGVTNGVHMPTWLGPEMTALFKAHGAVLEHETRMPTQPTGVSDRPRWEQALALPDGDLMAAHLAQKLRLRDFAKERIFEMSARHGRDPETLHAMLESLNPESFWIGFSRRFASYKRAALIFSDLKKARRLFNDPARPVQIFFSGKAHPADRGGQALIEEVFQESFAREFRGKVFFIENYDMAVGRMLVQGVDLWLNNPRRPLEASGTSGMKAAANGVPNASILDGWWDEAFDDRPGFENGFAIGGRKLTPNTATQDKRDARDLYEVLLNQVVPLYFGDPVRWRQIMKNSIASSLYDFSTARMLDDYMSQMYTRSTIG